jgi:hypothetical protein
MGLPAIDDHPARSANAFEVVAPVVGVLLAAPGVVCGCVERELLPPMPAHEARGEAKARVPVLVSRVHRVLAGFPDAREPGAILLDAPVTRELADVERDVVL